MATFEHILVPTDFSPCSRAALDRAVYFARIFHATVEVLHVWETQSYVGPEVVVHVPGHSQQTLAQFAHTVAEKRMVEFLADLERALPAGVVRGRVETGDPTEAILRVAVEDKAAMIVMGTHGRTGIKHALLGSVAEKVLRRAPCPVLITRAVEPSTEKHGDKHAETRDDKHVVPPAK